MKINKLRLLQPLFLLAFAAASASGALVAHYPLEGSVEQAVPGGPGTLTVFPAANPNPTWVAGIAPGSSEAIFLGPDSASGNRIGAPSNGIWNNVTGFSVSAWIQPQAESGNRSIFWLGAAGSTASARFTLQMTGTELRAGGRRVAANGFHTVQTTGLSLNLNQTYHVAATADYTTGWVHIYVNGAEVASGELTGWQVGGAYGSTETPATDHLFRFGTNSTGGEVFQGLLDDARIFNHVLSASEVAALAIPEPSISLLGAIGAMGLLRRRRNG